MYKAGLTLLEAAILDIMSRGALLPPLVGGSDARTTRKWWANTLLNGMGVRRMLPMRIISATSAPKLYRTVVD